MKPQLSLPIAYLALTALAHPTPEDNNGARIAKRAGVDLNNYRLKVGSSYTKQSNVDMSKIASGSDHIQTATNLVKGLFPDATFRLADDHYTGMSGLTHLNFKQTINNRDIQNANFHVNIAGDGTVLSYGHSFWKGNLPAVDIAKLPNLITAPEALAGVVKTLQLPVQLNSAAQVPLSGAGLFNISGVTGTVSIPTAKLAYYQTPQGAITPVWRIETNLGDDWLISYINGVGTGEILGVANYNAEASYNVYPWPIVNPVSGSRSNQVNPDDRYASKFGWQSNGQNTFTITAGNNGIAQANLNGNNVFTDDPRPESPTQNFNYAYDNLQPQPSTYTYASVTQLWYTANKYHDLLYELGFTEASGNFEENNNGAGGVGNDGVVLNAQDGSGFNNAFFSTPPDGQRGVMKMFIFTRTDPERDCSFDAGVVIHEYTHGLSNRLTGGASDSECLSTLESGGLGEGWSDFYPTAIRTMNTDTRAKNYPIGEWVTGRPFGIRQYPYSTDLKVNPLKYSSLNDYHEVHEIGTVWGTMLYEVMWNLIDARGNTAATTPTFRNNVPTDGRFLSMYLVLLGMAIQPCNPTFIEARDSILDADFYVTRGANRCAIWKGFAKRGLGVSAESLGANSMVDGFDVPSGC